MAAPVSSYFSKYADSAKKIVDKMPGIKWVGQHGTNYWTGFRVTKSASALFGGIAIAGAAAAIGLEIASGGDMAKRKMAAANAENVGPIPATRYESTGARSNLGATGDLVLGLNNMRRG